MRFPSPDVPAACADVRAESFALVDGELAPAAAAAVRAHLHECAPCRDAVTVDAGFVRWLRAHAAVAPAPRSLRDRVERLLARRPTGR